MREYEGAVLFVDILGVGALTTSNVPLVDENDFEALGWLSRLEPSNQLLCAVLLSKFRANLIAVEVAGLNVAQLSDSAFLWSKDADLLLDAAKKLFWLNSNAGVLARAGMAFGQIVEPEKVASHLGQFICGEAVTRAVALERAGKGARIFVDAIIPGLILNRFEPADFSALVNASDFSRIDEFIWFRAPGASRKAGPITAQQLLFTADLPFIMQASPMYRWNAASTFGQVQLAATIERIGLEITKIANGNKLKIPPGAVLPRELFLVGDPAHPESRSHARLKTMRAAGSR